MMLYYIRLYYIISYHIILYYITLRGPRAKHGHGLRAHAAEARPPA